jgi:hypothetical protein
MTGRIAARFESLVDVGAAALFAAAIAYALHWWIAGSAGVYGGGAAAFALSFAGLRRVEPEPRRFKVSDFVIQPIASMPELLLAEADRYVAREDELVLDDILAEIGPDSRVVRLFDPAAMPTPGQLKDRIDAHLDAGGPPGSPPDASQALFDALAELRRSLN